MQVDFVCTERLNALFKQLNKGHESDITMEEWMNLFDNPDKVREQMDAHEKAIKDQEAADIARQEAEMKAAIASIDTNAEAAPAPGVVPSALPSPIPSALASANASGTATPAVSPGVPGEMAEPVSSGAPGEKAEPVSSAAEPAAEPTAEPAAPAAP